MVLLLQYFKMLKFITFMFWIPSNVILRYDLLEHVKQDNNYLSLFIFVIIILQLLIIENQPAN